MASYTQDLPPKNGFEKIQWQAQNPTRLMRGYTQFALFAAFTLCGWVGFAFWRKRQRRYNLEMMDARVAIEPFLLAEKDRAILKHLRRCRDEENEVMKNVPGWKTGTLWGEPVYYNVRDRFIKPSHTEQIVHLDPKYVNKVQYNHLVQ
ncbi:unnamed protein product [Candidula unifasciata]|uniref:NADH dehydrogenase [ubiquinone] 1 alpha subcomplex subunit 13 n=1 Tax=Candidula unifasciata TaxID=100452 RepID=A0A8S3Z0B5_9EUPU|nr:unnamed protein product [Candidula unifasciata]